MIVMYINMYILLASGLILRRVSCIVMTNTDVCLTIARASVLHVFDTSN